MRALVLYAGPKARRLIEREGLSPSQVGVIPGAAGGPKGLVLGPLDRFIFGQWLSTSSQPVHLVGASIGAWRLACACLGDSVAAFERLESDYIAQDYVLEPGRNKPRPSVVSEQFSHSLHTFYAHRVSEILSHPRYAMHIVTTRGRHLLARENRWRTPLGYAGAVLSNAVHRKALSAWVERVVFSQPGAELPFATQDFRTRAVTLSEANFHSALQASCSIPFVLQAVHDIAGAPRGAYWDGGITDYHLHLNYRSEGVVLYPHFQKAVVPGWLDKPLKWRHGASAYLDNTVVLAPSAEWVAALPGGKLPDRNDFVRYGRDLAGRMRVWRTAASAAQQLADEFADWLRHPDPSRVQAL